MANDAKKKQHIKFLFDQCWKSNLLLEVHGGDIDFVKSKPCYHLTSTHAEEVAVRLLLSLCRKSYMPESYSIVCIFVKCIKHYPYLIRCLIP